MAKVAYISIKHFAVAIERRLHDGDRMLDRCGMLNGCPLIIGGYPHERKTVYDASEEAAAVGVKPGMALRQAKALCPNAVFLPLALNRYEEAVEEFLAAIECFSPSVEGDGLGGAYFDAQGLERLCGPDDNLAGQVITAIRQRIGVAPSIGLSSTRFSAKVAALLGDPGVGQIVSVSPVEFLSPLPVEYLRDTDTARTDKATRSYEVELAVFHDRLYMLGIHTISQFLQLPSSELMEQFGPIGLQAYRLIYGREEPGIVPRSQPAALQELQWFEPPLEGGTEIEHNIDRLSERLAEILRRRYQVCQTVMIRLELVGSAVTQTGQLKEPTSQGMKIKETALRLIQRVSKERDESEGIGKDCFGKPGDEGAGDGAGGIAAIQLVVTGLKSEGGRQLGLSDAQRQKREQLERAAAEVERRFGSRLKRAVQAPSLSSATAAPFVLQDYFS